LFRNTFTNGFPWELIEVFSGPPKVIIYDVIYFCFRIITGETIEMYGFVMITVNENFKIQSIEVFLKPDEFF